MDEEDDTFGAAWAALYLRSRDELLPDYGE